MGRSKKNNRHQKRTLDRESTIYPLTTSFLFDEQLNSWVAMVYYDRQLVEVFVEADLDSLYEEFKNFVDTEYPYVAYKLTIDKSRTPSVKQAILASFLAAPPR